MLFTLKKYIGGMMLPLPLLLITIALGLKAIFLVTTLMGLTGLWLAVLADSGATALVTANALRLLRNKSK